VAYESILGSKGLNVSPLPEPIAELCRREIAVAGLAVEAAITGDQQVALHALLPDRCLNGLETAQAMLNACLGEYAAYLPQFRPNREPG